MTGNTHKIVGIGEALWDMLPDGRQLGGAPANVVFHAQRLGVRADLVSCVGADADGGAIRAALEELGVGTDGLAVHPELETSRVIVELDAKGVPEYTILEPVAWDAIPRSDYTDELARGADAIVFGSLAQRAEMSRESIQRFLSEARPDCLRVFDINLRQDFFDTDTIVRSLDAASVLKINDEELPVVLELLGIADLDALMARFDLQLLALTCGGEGSRLISADGEHAQPVAPGVNVVDTVGAGDSFTAALIVGLLRGGPIPQVHAAASNLAAAVCSSAGATPMLPDSFVNGLFDEA